MIKADINKSDNIKRIILVCLVLVVAVLVITNADLLCKSKRVFSFRDHDSVKTEKVSVKGSHTIDQSIVIDTKAIGKIGILFNNSKQATAKGKVNVKLSDSQGDTIGTTSVDASNIRENRYTFFLFGKDSNLLNGSRISGESGRSLKLGTTKVNKGEEYTLSISTEDLTSEGDLDIILCRDSSTDKMKKLSFDGNDEGNACLYMVARYQVYSKNAICMIAVILSLTMILIFIPYRSLDEKIAGKLKRENFKLSTWLTRAMFIASPLVAYFVIQRYASFGLSRFLSQLLFSNGRGMLNLLIIGLMWWLIYTISNRVRITSMLTVLISSVFGLSNYCLVLFRDYPLIASDLAQFGTAMQVAESYSFVMVKETFTAIFLTVLWCIASFAPPGHRGLSGKKRLISIAILLLWSGLFYYTFFVSSTIKDRNIKVDSFKPSATYNYNGSALSFIVTLKNSVVEKPNGYSVDEIRRMSSEDYPSDSTTLADSVSRKTPNIIIVMNESFADESVLGEFDTNEDYMPFYSSIKENAVKGWLSSSVFGSSTANSEFECLTGFSTRFLPFRSVPFRSIIRDHVPTLTDDLKAMGYGGNIAFHPGLRSSYNREQVYPLLGFDRHIAKEDLNDPELVRAFVSDSYDYKYVEKTYEEYRKSNDKPFYMFNVTIQNHGGYSLETGTVDAGIKITSEEFEPSATQFLNLMKLSDDALKELIDYYSKVDEETVIVLYGDHQPKLGDLFYTSMKQSHEGISDFEWEELRHRVPFLIWANFDIPERENVFMSINYLSPYMKEVIGMPMTGFDKYLMDLYKSLPVLNTVCCIDAEGKIYDESTASDKYGDQLQTYSQIQYNGLVDSSHRVNELFELNREKDKNTGNNQ